MRAAGCACFFWGGDANAGRLWLCPWLRWFARLQLSGRWRMHACMHLLPVLTCPHAALLPELQGLPDPVGRAKPRQHRVGRAPQRRHRQGEEERRVPQKHFGG